MPNLRTTAALLPSGEACRSIVFALLADAETYDLIRPMVDEARADEAALVREACAAASALLADTFEQDAPPRPALRLIKGGAGSEPSD